MLGRTHDLQGRIALVIGGGMGVGKVVAHQLASQTAKIAELILTSAA